MKVLLIVLGVVALIAVLLFSVVVGGMNRVVGMDEDVNGAWAQVENQLQRRNDLIPNLVKTVKGYAAHEKEVFLKVADARAKLAGRIEMNESVQNRIAAAKELGSALSRLLMVVERYPELKANQNFMKLQDELSGTENRIAVERRRYNETVKGFNKYIRQVPGSFFATLKGLSKAEYFNVTEEAKKLPEVDFK